MASLASTRPFFEAIGTSSNTENIEAYENFLQRRYSVRALQLEAAVVIEAIEAAAEALIGDGEQQQGESRPCYCCYSSSSNIVRPQNLSLVEILPLKL